LVRIHREALAVAQAHPAELAQARTGLGTYLFDLGRAHLSGGDSAAARRCFGESARTFPAFRSRLKARAAVLGGRPFIGLLEILARRKKGVIR